MAFLFHISVKEINLYPLGGITKFNMDLNIDSRKELVILVGGPLFQQFAYYLLILLFPSRIDFIQFYHYHILFFNLLPVFPLDGGRISCLFLELFFPYRTSRYMMMSISIITVFILFFHNYTFTINKIIMIVFLLILVLKEWRKIPILYHTFLLERYLNHYLFRKSRVIISDKDFFRDTHHILFIEDQYYLEEEYLKKKYDKNRKSY